MSVIFNPAAGGKKFALGLVEPDEEDLLDEESVAFFQETDDEVVAAPLTYNAVTLGR